MNGVGEIFCSREMEVQAYSLLFNVYCVTIFRFAIYIFFKVYFVTFFLQTVIPAHNMRFILLRKVLEMINPVTVGTVKNLGICNNGFSDVITIQTSVTKMMKINGCIWPIALVVFIFDSFSLNARCLATACQ